MTDAAEKTEDPTNSGNGVEPDARVVRISGQMVEMRVPGQAPRAGDLFIGIDDTDLRVEIATLPGDGLARGLLLSGARPVTLG
ncbi:MAG: hypothetical protein WCD16_05340, partial [Paracoccaceae bacterium]